MSASSSAPNQLPAEVSSAFIKYSRQLIAEEYLPKIQRCLEQLSDEQIWWRANEESNSIGNLILHIAGNARQWIISGLGGAEDKRERDTEFAERRIISGRDLNEHLSTTMKEVDRVLSEFPVERLLRSYLIQNTQTLALEAIFHVTEHISMHTGQIILLTKLLAPKNLLFYDFSSGAPVHTWHEPKP
jgi:uncharacterized damage-inducible protein DinB